MSRIVWGVCAIACITGAETTRATGWGERGPRADVLLTFG